MKPNVFALLVEPIRSALNKMGFSNPTETQEKSVPSILKGENVLLVAPTGSGKTEAAVLPVFSNFLQSSDKTGISILYVTPLRALNRDMVKRLTLWANMLGLTVEVRHGDTEVKVRRKQALVPPNMLITTPESLQAILPGRLMRNHLRNVRFVIIDEFHELAEDKRGVQLSVALERLREITGKEFQRIGLSATVGTPHKVAAFISGSNRQIKIIKASTPKDYIYTVEYPIPQEADYELADRLETAPEAAARIRRTIDLIRSHSSTLIFVNSRTNAEMLGYKLGLLSSEVTVHHGSLSKEERSIIEDQFKTKALKAIVCTSTLELGIDIGHVDLTIQYLSPRRVSSLIQRVGRSGHQLGKTSRGVILAASTDDVLESIAAVRRAYKNLLEPISIHFGALDVLAHQIAGITMDKREIQLDDAYEIIHRAYPYRNLSMVKFLEVVNYLSDIREIRKEGNVLRKTGRTRRYYYENLSMIPDERKYPLIDVLSDRKIGTLGDEFMALRARIGLNIIVKGKVWRIVQIEDETGRVYAVPSEDPTAAIPGWDGEMLPLHMNLAQEVGKIRCKITDELNREKNPDKAIEKLAEKLSLKPAVFRDAVSEIHEQMKRGLPIPIDDLVLVEAFDKYLVIHSCFGEVVNWTLGCVFDAILSDNELITGWWNDGYRILIEAPCRIDEYDLVKIRKMLFELKDKNVDKAFQDYLEAHFPFSYKMKFVAERFGALPRGKALSYERLSQLPSRFKNTPIYEETLREAMIEKADLKAVKDIMNSIKSGKIHVETALSREKFSPMAYHILAKYAETAEFLAPLHVLLNNIERMKKSIDNRVVKLLCFSCGQWSTEIVIKKISEHPTCENCRSGLLTSLRRYQDLENLKAILQKHRNKKELTGEEMKILSNARRAADLVLSYGKQAIIALQVKGIGPETAFRILGKMHVSKDDFYMELLKAKIQFLRTRQYWDDKNSEKF